MELKTEAWPGIQVQTGTQKNATMLTKRKIQWTVFWFTPPKFNSSPLKNDAWKLEDKPFPPGSQFQGFRGKTIKIQGVRLL